MSNESSGLEFGGNQDVIANVIKPEFEFKGTYTLDVDNSLATDLETTTEIDINSNNDSIEGDTFNSNKDINSHVTLGKETPIVIQQKYGASMKKINNRNMIYINKFSRSQLQWKL